MKTLNAKLKIKKFVPPRCAVNTINEVVEKIKLIETKNPSWKDLYQDIC